MKKYTSLLFILLLSLAVRLPLLSGSFWLDEAAQALESIRPLASQFQIAEDYQPPLFHLFVHFFALFSHQEWWLRIPSLFSGLATIGIMYVLLAERFHKRSALWGSLLLVLSPFHIFYSQELRPYALATLFATASWYILVSNRCSSRRWIWYTSACALGMYSMYLFPFVIFSQLLYIVFEDRTKLKALGVSLSIVAILFLPWVPSFLNQLQVGRTLTTQLPGWSQAVATPQLKAIPLTLGKFLVGQVRFGGNLPLMILVGVFLFGLLLVIYLDRGNQRARFFVYWLLIPIVGSWLLSFFLPIIQPKRLLICLPALLGLCTISPGKYRSVLVWTAFLIELLALGWYWYTPSLQREDWRQTIAIIEADAPVGSTAYFSFPTRFAPWEWYSHGKVGYQATGKLLLGSAQDVVSVDSQLTSATTVYLFDYLRDLTDPHHLLEPALQGSGFVERGSIDGQTIGFVRIFARMNKN